MTTTLLILILVIILLFGGGWYGYRTNPGSFPYFGGVIGIIILVLVILWATGKLHLG